MAAQAVDQSARFDSVDRTLKAAGTGSAHHACGDRDHLRHGKKTDVGKTCFSWALILADFALISAPKYMYLRFVRSDQFNFVTAYYTNGREFSKGLELLR